MSYGDFFIVFASSEYFAPLQKHIDIVLGQQLYSKSL